MKPFQEHPRTAEEQGGPESEAQRAASKAGNGSPHDADSPGDGTAEAAESRASREETERLRGELEAARQQLAERQDAYLRLQAELENFKKRVLREQAENLRYAQLPLLKDLTVAMDNLQRALEHARKAASPEAVALAEGVELVARQLGDSFERFGMQRVPAEGMPFDPTRHEAVSVVETNEVPDNQVLQEFRAGYVLHDRVVRPAMVSVSRRASAGGPAAAGPTHGEAKDQSEQ